VGTTDPWGPGQELIYTPFLLNNALGPDEDTYAVFARLLQGDPSVPRDVVVGNHMFYSADYMVHTSRRNWLASSRSISPRTVSSECINGENLKGTHLADGTNYLYLLGDEYADAFPAWDWYRIPGTTVRIGGCPLDCNHVHAQGTQMFVGGVSTGQIGMMPIDFVAPFGQG
jgi:hypothetical protein